MFTAYSMKASRPPASATPKRAGGQDGHDQQKDETGFSTVNPRSRASRIYTEAPQAPLVEAMNRKALAFPFKVFLKKILTLNPLPSKRILKNTKEYYLLVML